MAKAKGAKASAAKGAVSNAVVERFAAYGGWKAELLSKVRSLVLEAVPDMEEACKWIKPTNPLGVAVWSHGGIVCTGEAYKHVVKLTFPRGASLEDPQGLFNASLEGNARRAIDLREGEKLDAKAFKALILAAVVENLKSKAPKAESAKQTGAKGKPVKLLSGGNPQIAKADGDEPVQAYIAAMPGWKSDLGKRIDEVIVRTLPKVRKAVRWNSPFYGVEGKGWMLSFHVLTKYVKVTFFDGLSLKPIPPGGTEKSKEARWIDFFEDDEFDEAQFAKWVKQAAKLPGWTP